MKKIEDNLVDIPTSNLSKYTKLKEGDEIKSGDFVHLYDNTYAELSKGHKLTRDKLNKHNIVLRSK